MVFDSVYFQHVIQLLKQLPGIGSKSSQRIVLNLLQKKRNYIYDLSQALVELDKNINECSTCGLLGETDPCTLCIDKHRENTKICVVSHSHDAFHIDRCNGYKGAYHVLGGLISPLNNVHPENLRIENLEKRIAENNPPIEELILALHPSPEGETTMFYLHKRFSKFPLSITRMAYGIPIGAEFEFIDEITLHKAFSDRIKF